MAGPSMPEVDYGSRILQDQHDQMVRHYGAATVREAEIVSCIEVFFMIGVVKPNEFLELVARSCYKADQRRRAEAKIEEDRG